MDINILKGESLDTNCYNLKTQLTQNEEIGHHIGSITINDTGDTSMLDMSNVFNNCVVLTDVDLSNANTITCFNMSNMFNNCINLTNIELFNSNNVRNTSNMFRNCVNLTNVPNLDLSKAKDLSGMFSDCTNLTNIPDMTICKGTNGSSLFANCNNIESAPNINYSNFKNLAYMFYNTNLQQTPDMVLNNINYGDLTEIYGGCDNIISVNNLWINNGYLDSMIFYSGMLTYIDNVKIMNSESVYGVLYGTNIYNYETYEERYTLQSLLYANICIENVNTAQGLISGTPATADITLTFDNVKAISSIISSADYYYGAPTRANSINVIIGNGLINTDGMLSNISIIQDEYSWYPTPNIVNVTIGDFSKVTSMANFAMHSQSISPLPNFDTSNVTDMSNAFYGFMGPLPNFDTSNVTNMSNAFGSYCQDYSGSSYPMYDLPDFDTSNVTNFSNVIYGASIINFPNWNFSKAEDITGLCYQLDFVPNINTANVKTMASVFEYSQVMDFSSSNFIYWNTSNVRNADRMFYQVMAQTSLPNMNTSNITSMQSFIASSNINNVNIIAQWNLDNVKSIRYMFSNMKFLTYIPDLTFPNVTDIVGLFSNTNNLVHLPNFTFSTPLETVGSLVSYTNIPQAEIFNFVNNLPLADSCDTSGMFSGCRQLTSFPNINYTKINSASRMFADCSNITEDINIYSTSLMYMNNMFEFCNNVSNATFNLQYPGTLNGANFKCGGIFRACSKLQNINLTINYDLANSSMYSAGWYASNMFNSVSDLKSINLDLQNVRSITSICDYCNNLKDVTITNVSVINTLGAAFGHCNNLTLSSINNIVEACLNMPNVYYKNLSNTNSYSPFSYTNIGNSKYSAYHSRLTAAGWTF